MTNLVSILGTVMTVLVTNVTERFPQQESGIVLTPANYVPNWQLETAPVKKWVRTTVKEYGVLMFEFRGTEQRVRVSPERVVYDWEVEYRRDDFRPVSTNRINWDWVSTNVLATNVSALSDGVWIGMMATNTGRTNRGSTDTHGHTRTNTDGHR